MTSITQVQGRLSASELPVAFLKSGAPSEKIFLKPPPAGRELVGPRETVFSVTIPIVPLIIALRKTVEITSTKTVWFIYLHKCP